MFTFEMKSVIDRTQSTVCHMPTLSSSIIRGAIVLLMFFFFFSWHAHDLMLADRKHTFFYGENIPVWIFFSFGSGFGWM